MGEISLRGIEAIADNNAQYTCQATLVLNGTAVNNLTNSITYQASLTPLLTSVSPRFGQVVGDEVVTFTGTNFASDITLYTILIDDIPCVVHEASVTEVQCVTGKRPGLQALPTLVININGIGNVAT